MMDLQHMFFDILFNSHLIWLWLVLGFFIVGTIRKNTVYTLAGLANLITAVYISYKRIDSSFCMHLGVDMMLVSCLGYFAMQKGKLVRLIYIIAASMVLFTAHSFIPNHLEYHTISKETGIHPPADPNGELLAKFENQKSLKAWISKNKSHYKIIYPAFTPEDNSYGLDEYLIIDLKESESIENTINKLESQSRVAYAEVNEIVELKLPPNNSRNTIINKTSAINDPDINKQWVTKNYDIDKYHQKLSDKTNNYKSDGSLIAILDTGIDAQHEDLQNNYFSTLETYDTDVRGHGTHCAGIAAAVTGNGIGIASWIPKGASVKITSIKVLNNMGMGTQRSIVNGILKAADMGADVISLSLGARSTPSREKAYQEAVSYAMDKGSIVVVAAGNSKSDALNYSPANTPGVITVAAVDSTFQLAEFSNYVDNLSQGISAPGAGIYSTLPGNQYGAQNGTSMAAPFVSGIIGMMRLYNPNITTEEAYDVLRTTAIKNQNQSIANPIGVLDTVLE